MITYIGRQLRVVLLTVAPLAMSSALPASASAFTEPGFTGTMADFLNCPVNVTLTLGGPHGASCDHSYTTGGVVQIGHSVVPISVPGDTFDLGVTSPEGGSAVSPPNGILNGPAQPVPTGLLGTVGNLQLTGASAKLEWAASVSPGTTIGFTEGCLGANPLVTFDICRILNAQPGTATTLRTKVHLISPFLGPNCYIGSAANPIVIPLTTGLTSPPPPTLPIHGRAAEFVFEPGKAYEQAIGLRLVNNSFAVPVATGCGTSGGSLVNASINHKLGLPSPPGQNMIAITANAEQAPASLVLASGWTGE